MTNDIKQPESLTVIGRAERVDLIDLPALSVPAKVDTGADASSIWAHVVEQRGDKLFVVFFGEGFSQYTGKEFSFDKGEYTITRVANSFGHKELRFKVKLRIKIKQRIINGTFTLSDRSQKLYPILIGRSLLTKKFIVDVSKGNPLRGAEKERARKLQKDIAALKGEVPQ
jgi:hypothetical protein